MDFMEKIKQLAEERNTTLTGLERELDFGNNSIKRWGKNSPSIDKVVKLANYLDVSLDWLLLDKKSEIHLSNYDEQILSSYNLLDETDKVKIRNFIEIAILNSDNKYLKEDSVTYSFQKKIPIRGYVAAGTPIEAIDNILNTVSSPKYIDADYALIVKGDSMKPIIRNEETIYIKSVQELYNGDIGIFYYNGNVTCKKYFKENSTIKLVSINPKYNDIVFDLKDTKNEYIGFKIEGKVLLTVEQEKRYN